MTLLFKETYIECFLDSEAKVLFHIWHSKPTSAQFRSALTRVFNEYQKYKTNFSPTLHWLGDTRKMGVLTIDDQGWLQKVWNDMLFNQAGVKTHVVIIGNDVFSKYAMEKFKTAIQQLYADKNLHLETFPDKDSAYRWFKNIEANLKPGQNPTQP